MKFDQAKADMYIGTKVLHAYRMTRGEYNAERGWTIPADENPEDPGFVVSYADGYVSWSPEAVFQESYRNVDLMDFGHAIYFLKLGGRVSRSGWNGKGMWLEMMSGGTTTTRSGTEHEALPFIVMKTADDKIVPRLASQTDVLAEDWAIVS